MDRELCKRVWYAIGSVESYAHHSWDYCPVQPVDDERHPKQNYSVAQWLKKASDCVEYLKKHFPVKYVSSAYGRIYFYIDDTAIKLAIMREREEAEAKRIAELNAIDLRPYTPTKKVLEKLTSYFNKGSKVNVGAITDPIKMLTYLYGACLLGWNDLWYAIRNTYTFGYSYKVNGTEFGKIQEAIDFRVKVDPTVQVERSKAEDHLLSFSKKVWKAVKDSGLEFDYKSVPTTYDECWKDRKNGCAWTIAKLLTVGDKSVRFSIVTNEGVDSPDYGYQFSPCEGWLLNKGQLEDGILSRLGLA